MLETQEESGVDTFDAISRGAWPSGKVFYTFARSFSSSKLISLKLILSLLISPIPGGKEGAILHHSPHPQF